MSRFSFFARWKLLRARRRVRIIRNMRNAEPLGQRGQAGMLEWNELLLTQPFWLDSGSQVWRNQQKIKNVRIAKQEGIWIVMNRHTKRGWEQSSEPLWNENSARSGDDHPACQSWERRKFGRNTAKHAVVEHCTNYNPISTYSEWAYADLMSPESDAWLPGVPADGAVCTPGRDREATGRLLAWHPR